MAVTKADKNRVAEEFVGKWHHADGTMVELVWCGDDLFMGKHVVPEHLIDKKTCPGGVTNIVGFLWVSDNPRIHLVRIDLSATSIGAVAQEVVYLVKKGKPEYIGKLQAVPYGYTGDDYGGAWYTR